MKIKVDTTPKDVEITFSPRQYCLVKCKAEEILGEYSLNHLVDRSEKGKDPDIGLEVLFLSESQAELFRKAGFSEMYL